MLRRAVFRKSATSGCLRFMKHVTLNRKRRNSGTDFRVVARSREPLLPPSISGPLVSRRSCAIIGLIQPIVACVSRGIGPDRFQLSLWQVAQRQRRICRQAGHLPAMQTVGTRPRRGRRTPAAHSRAGSHRGASGGHAGIAGGGRGQARFSRAGAAARRVGPPRLVPRPEGPRRRRHGHGLPGRGPGAEADGGPQGDAARSWPPSAGPPALPARGPGHGRRRASTTSSPSTRSARSAACRSWPCRCSKASRWTSASARDGKLPVAEAAAHRPARLPRAWRRPMRRPDPPRHQAGQPLAGGDDRPRQDPRFRPGPCGDRQTRS